MASVVSIDTVSGALRRYEIGGTTYRLTHIAMPRDSTFTLTPRMIELFRIYPDPAFAVEPPPKPPAPPTGSAEAPRLAA